jgi:hypothetical protein
MESDKPPLTSPHDSGSPVRGSHCDCPEALERVARVLEQESAAKCKEASETRVDGRPDWGLQAESDALSIRARIFRQAASLLRDTAVERTSHINGSDSPNSNTKDSRA